MSTILITGCSSGFGLASATLFANRGWNVVATMREPRENVLPQPDRMRLMPLDVTHPECITRTVEAAVPIDALVNNVGIELLGAVKGTPIPVAREILETNTLGTVAMTHAVVP